MRMKALPLTAALVSAGALGAWLASGPPPLPDPAVAVNQALGRPPPAAVEQMIPEVEKLHGRNFARPPAVVRLSPDLFREKVRLRMARQVSPAGADARQRAALAMGLTRVPFDWVDSLTGIAMETDYCQYDEATNTFFLLESSGAFASPQIIFEIARALILESLGGNRLTEFNRMNDDASLAAQCVIEGAATQLQTRYYIAYPETPAATPTPAAPAIYYEAPPYLRSRLLFPSSMAPGFQRFLLENCTTPDEPGAMLSGLFSRPPRSSAEVMHPELYLNPTTRAPVEILLPSAAGTGTALIFDNVMGEFGTLQVLKAYLTQEGANSAAAGWHGDRYQIFGNSAGSADAAVWQIEWTTEAEASDFLAAAHEWLLARFSLRSQSTYEQPGGGFLIEESTFACRTARVPNARSVRLLFSADPALVHQLHPHFFP